jgi:Outer membrane protein beta-barrel domain
MKKRFFLLGLLLCLAGVNVFAQSNEVGVTFGGQFVSGDYDFGHSGVFEVNPAHRILNGEVAGLYVEVPLTWTFKNARTDPSSALHDHYTSFFFTPGLKVKVLPQLPISPYGFVGVGLAHFHDSDTDQGSYENVIDYGAGVDWKLAPFISVRGELRDFNSGVPRLGFPNPGSRQQNVMATVGLSLHF